LVDALLTILAMLSQVLGDLGSLLRLENAQQVQFV
jgi:hypothetical protein